MKLKLQPYVLNIVRQLSDDRKQRHIEPAVAGEIEIMRVIQDSLRQSLDSLEEDGVLGHFENVNGIKMYYPVDKHNRNLEENKNPHDNIDPPLR